MGAMGAMDGTNGTVHSNSPNGARSSNSADRRDGVTNMPLEAANSASPAQSPPLLAHPSPDPVATHFSVSPRLLALPHTSSPPFDSNARSTLIDTSEHYAVLSTPDEPRANGYGLSPFTSSLPFMHNGIPKGSSPDVYPRLSGMNMAGDLLRPTYEMSGPNAGFSACGPLSNGTELHYGGMRLNNRDFGMDGGYALRPKRRENPGSHKEGMCTRVV